ncbi:PREDICTED: uncharacterized protein LOC104604586 [Nelumbo nucifera]|uniref:PHD-type domain-containing protein n=2 Tax=Nelumbo nucifera TaxID=4432 RepID=A0A823A0B3_NELNU|nr:PREDICTED: uncharacterized protein LOC104604586 [Nelumbo nucifera]DAD48769.1 TPA_asm: hypothetical protein HUJ06_018706 [Nelumbo nucifera]
MANGTDSEQFVLLSGIRTGLKREFAFALKVQAELSGSLGRTRARKFQNSPSGNEVSENSKNKRFKSSHAKKNVKNVEVKSSTEEEPTSDSVEPLLEVEPHIDFGKLADIEEPKNILLQYVGTQEPTGDLVKPATEEESKNSPVQSVGTEESQELNGDPVKPATEEGYRNNSVQSVGTEESNCDLVKPATEDESTNNPVQSIGTEEPDNELVKCSDKEEPNDNLVQYVEKEHSDSDLVNSAGEEEMKNDLMKSVESEQTNNGFALTFHSELGSSLGRTRASKFQNSHSSSGVLEYSRNKRLKSSHAKEDMKNDEVKSSTKKEPKSDLLNSLFQEEPKSNVLKPATEAESNNNPLQSVGTEESDGDLVKSTSKEETKNNLAQSVGKEQPNSDLVNHACADEIVFKNDLMKSVEAEEPDNDEANFQVQKGSQNDIVKSQAEEGTTVETPIVIDDNSEVVTIFPVRPPRRFTRSALTEGLKNNLLKAVVKKEPIEIPSPSSKKSKNETRKLIKEEGTSVETVMVHGDVSEGQNASQEKFPRRFTRSQLKKPKAEPIEISATTSWGSVVSEDSKNEAIAKAISAMPDVVKSEPVTIGDRVTSDVVSPLRTPTKKKLEMKMSKKIALTKLPTRVKDLLETGLLEGLSVRYLCRSRKQGGLKGTIKDRGILCSCTSCKGSNVVTPFHFEQHAGSTNKRAAQYIYLENGNSLHDVLEACKGAPLDELEATIKSAIGLSPIKASTRCQNCKGSLTVSGTRRSVLLCKSCLEAKKSQTSPASRTGTTPGSSKSAVTPKSSNSALKAVSVPKSKGRLTRKDLRLHKLVFEDGGLPDGTEVAYYARGQKLLEGYKKGFGIFCRCCNTEVSASQFEGHAGWASRRKPYLNIFTSNGVSLHELAVSLSKGRKFSANDNDDLCSICADGGDLLLCDNCPRAFHKDCLSLSSVPRGDWYCNYCQNMFEREKFDSVNAKAAGRVAGVDPIEQINKRCIRIVNTPENEVGGCVLCRGHGFTKSGFGPRTVLLCDQCEKEFHVGCLREHKMADLKELPKGTWFCCTDCSRIHSALQKLLDRGSEKLPDSLSSIIRKKHEEKCSEEQRSDADLDVRWRLLSGKNASPETKLLLSKAVAIFHDCFDPIVDSTTGRDLIPSMVYGRNLRDQEFGGMYCAVLTVNSSVVSAGILRIFGREVAELPLVATSKDNQGQGYFQSLFSCIERLLGFLNVKTLVLPAADEAESIWTEKFGFTKIPQDELSNLRKDCQMMTFQGTAMLQKPVPRCRIIGKPTEVS